MAAEEVASGARRAIYERARLAAEIGERALTSGPWLAGRADHVAASLHAESIGWSLRALQGSRQAAGPQPRYQGPPETDELRALLEAHGDVLLPLMAASELDQFHGWLLQRTFESLDGPAQEARQAAFLLSRVARQLLRKLDPPRRSARLLALQRALLCLAAVAALAGLAWAVHTGQEAHEVKGDLSAGKPWRASSSYQSACSSPQRHCSAASSFFFHTREEANPWLELDLLQERSFSTVRVFNRRDCCSERAAPLAVEVSSDQVHWREVRRTTESFDIWTAQFSHVRARWVRLRALHTTFLHLRDVRVLE